MTLYHFRFVRHTYLGGININPISYQTQRCLFIVIYKIFKKIQSIIYGEIISSLKLARGKFAEKNKKPQIFRKT